MTSTEIANIDEELAKYAKAAVAVEKPTGSTITVRAGILSYNGTPVPGNKLDAIIIASTHANLFYEGAFDPNNLSNPVCFAYSEDGKEMIPHSASSKKQAESCDECPMNAWGSDPGGGRGKACKNIRVLGMIPASTEAEQVPTAEIAVLKTPVTSVKDWGQYVNKLDALYQRPPFGMTTELGTVPDQKSQFKLTFQPKGLVDNGKIGAIMRRRSAAMEILERVYEPNPEPSAESATPAKKRKF